MDLKPDNLMTDANGRLLICDYGLAGEGRTANYMSEELAGLRRALAAAKTDEEYRRIKLEKLVTAATTDIVAAALLTLELYMQSNRWPLIMLNATEAAGVDAKRALEMA